MQNKSISYIKVSLSAAPKSRTANLLLFMRQTLFCMTFATWPTVSWAVQLPIRQCVPRSHLLSQTMHAILNANYSLPYII